MTRAGASFDLWLLKVGAEIVAVDAEQADAARRARRRYGKGRHAAALNYGDCFSYALALTRGEPLLFKGEDFFEDRRQSIERSPTSVTRRLHDAMAHLYRPADRARPHPGGMAGR